MTGAGDACLPFLRTLEVISRQGMLTHWQPAAQSLQVMNVSRVVGTTTPFYHSTTGTAPQRELAHNFSATHHITHTPC